MIGHGLTGLKPPTAARNLKKYPPLIFNNFRSCILPLSAPCPNLFKVLQSEKGFKINVMKIV